MAVLEASASRSVASRRPRVDPTRPSRRGAPAARSLPAVACGHRRAPVPLSLMVALGVAVCLTVIGLVALSNAFVGTPTVPTRTAVVRVERGETLTELAERVAPHSDRAAVVDRIRELNGLGDSGLRPGQPLRVPSEG